MLFTKDEDFLAFERVIEETLRTRRMRVCAYCLLSNHWHFVLWPERDGDLSAFMHHMTNMHVKRWKQHRREIGVAAPRGAVSGIPLHCSPKEQHCQTSRGASPVCASCDDAVAASAVRRRRDHHRATSVV